MPLHADFADAFAAFATPRRDAFAMLTLMLNYLCTRRHYAPC